MRFVPVVAAWVFGGIAYWLIGALGGPRWAQFMFCAQTYFYIHDQFRAVDGGVR